MSESYKESTNRRFLNQLDSMDCAPTPRNQGLQAAIPRKPVLLAEMAGEIETVINQINHKRIRIRDALNCIAPPRSSPTEVNQKEKEVGVSGNICGRLSDILRDLSLVNADLDHEACRLEELV